MWGANESRVICSTETIRHCPLRGCESKSSGIAAVVFKCQLAKMYFMYCRYKMWWIARFRHPLSPMDSTSAVWLQPTFLLSLSLDHLAKFKYLLCPLEAWLLSPLVDVWLQFSSLPSSQWSNSPFRPPPSPPS